MTLTIYSNICYGSQGDKFITDMEAIIVWCNDNIGFLTAVLSFLTLLVSVIAVCVSIRTARLPFKKKIKLGSKVNVLIEQNVFSRKIQSEVGGITVEAINLVNRSVNISYLGFAVKSFGKSLQKIQTTNRVLGGTGILNPTEVVDVEYTVYELNELKQFNDSTKLFCCAIDTEGKTYKKYYGRVGTVVRNINNM